MFKIGDLAYVHGEEDREEKGHSLVHEREAIDLIDIVPVVNVKDVRRRHGKDIGIYDAEFSRADLRDVAADRSVGKELVRRRRKENASPGPELFALPFQFSRAEGKRSRPGVFRVRLERLGRRGDELRNARRTRRS